MAERLSLHRRNRLVPVFLAADDKYIQYMMVTMKSIIANATDKYRYRLHVLHTDITIDNQAAIKRLETDNCEIMFVDVRDELKKIAKKIALRDYYTDTTYYRLFIADMFPEYKKIVYVDSDTVVRCDIAELYRYDMGKNYIGAVRDQLVVQTDIYGDYVEKVLGISRGAYFNAGVVLINCEAFREKHMLKQFVDLLGTYTFVVAQDQDYLNILCKDKVLWVDPRWNVQMIGALPCDEDKAKLIHYNLAAKPWHYKDCRMGEYFWEYARQTDKYDMLKETLENFTKEDKERDKSYGDNLQHLALSEIHNSHNYYNMFGNNEPPKLTRIEVLKRIEELEKAGIFDQDVEDDPPARELKPAEVDYLRRKVQNKLRTRYAFRVAHWFVDALILKKQFVVKEIVGLEYLKNLDTGAVITCNHFNAFDSFAMQLMFEKAKKRGKKLFRVISEANYTAFPGFYGFLMRNCNTLPLSSNKMTMKLFMRAVNKILQKGHYILVYAEQSMWWNYRKPKPLKKGAFTFAANNNVPILPCFITMEDT
nr:1-acyl-sn-glycerol-3-phosphate acyltransferase [Acetatifactor sp.]